MSNAGRPKIDLDLPEGWQKTILEMYRDGCSDVEVKAQIYELRGSFSNNLWDRWMEEEEEFWETIKIGRMLAEAWWNRKGRHNLDNKEFSFTGWYMNMKNRYSWKDKSEFDHTTKGEAINIIHLGQGVKPDDIIT